MELASGGKRQKGERGRARQTEARWTVERAQRELEWKDPATTESWKVGERG